MGPWAAVDRGAVVIRTDMGVFVDVRMGPPPVRERLPAPPIEGPGRRQEPCACGGVITAGEATWESVADAVRSHQRSVRHVGWRLGLRLDQEPLSATPDGLGVVMDRAAAAAGGGR